MGAVMRFDTIAWMSDRTNVVMVLFLLAASCAPDYTPQYSTTPSYANGGAAPPGQPLSPAVSWTGTFQGTGTVSFVEADDKVMGIYRWSDGAFGVIQGPANGTNRLDFEWTERRGNLSTKGRGSFWLTPDGTSFTGTWGTGYSANSGGNWSGQRTTDRPNLFLKNDETWTPVVLKRQRVAGAQPAVAAAPPASSAASCRGLRDTAFNNCVESLLNTGKFMDVLGVCNATLQSPFDPKMGAACAVYVAATRYMMVQVADAEAMIGGICTAANANDRVPLLGILAKLLTVATARDPEESANKFVVASIESMSRACGVSVHDVVQEFKRIAEQSKRK